MKLATYKQFFKRPFKKSEPPRLLQPVMVMGDLHGYAFLCSGCGARHYLATEVNDAEGRRWIFNKDLARPTFIPSLRVVVDHEDQAVDVCHVSVTNGMLDFHLDSTHWLAGETVPMRKISD